jgi:hypothetical protein
MTVSIKRQVQRDIDYINHLREKSKEEETKILIAKSSPIKHLAIYEKERDRSFEKNIKKQAIEVKEKERRERELREQKKSIALQDAKFTNHGQVEFLRKVKRQDENISLENGKEMIETDIQIKDY